MNKANNLKYKQEYEKWYYMKWKNKPKRNTVYQRLKKWWAVDEALKCQNSTKKRLKIDTQNWRQCSECFEYKSWANFAKDKTNSYGRTVNCKQCRNIRKHKLRQDTKFKQKENQKKREYRRTERWKKQVQLYNLYYKYAWNNIKILKSLWEDKDRTQQQVKKDQKDLLLRLGMYEQFKDLFDNL